MINEIKQQITDILKKAGVKGEVELTIPPNQEMGDFAFACFGLAKEKSKDPVQVAKEIEEKFKIQNSKFKIAERIEVMGPYVNFYLSTSELAKLMDKELDKNFGENKTGKGKKVMIEYPSQNTHKEFHIGHLRSVCIGNTIVELYKKNGYKVVPVNYINDFGRHVVKCLWGVLKNHKSKIINPKSIVNKQKWLGEVYVEASKYIEEHKEEVTPELNELQAKLEARDKEIWELFMETRGWSMAGFAKILAELGYKNEEDFFESDVKDRGQEIVDELLKKKLAQVGEGGALIIDLEKYKLDIALLRKSTGAGVYLTSDLALAEKKFKKYKVDESINITGSEQDFYFRQLFKVLELNGFKYKMTHIGYGLVNLPEGKMSSRAGNVILYEDLRDEIFSYIKKETAKRHEDWTEKKIEEVAHTLTMAILKFTMLKHESNKVIKFDFSEAVSFEGFSAPYILYVVARINSLLRKGGSGKRKEKIEFELLKEPEVKRLLLLIANYPEVVQKAWENYNPSTITNYCFELAQAFNDFYNKCSVLKAESEALFKTRLALCGSVKFVLEDALGLLTIETVEEM